MPSPAPKYLKPDELQIETVNAFVITLSLV